MRQDLRTTSPNAYREQRYREGKFICDICLMLWPMSHQRKMRGGLRVGVLCCFEPDGDSTALDLKRAYVSKIAARIAAGHAQPPKAPDGVPYAGITELAAVEGITQIRWGSGFTSVPPVILSRGGSAVAVRLTGFGFDEDDDEIEYGAAGITDSTSPVFDSATQISLSVQASGGMSAGEYTLTFNDTVWQAVFSVR